MKIMKSIKKTNYDESKIQTLSATEHIRKRPGMYIGRLGNGSEEEDGIYILIKEILDNAVDEFVMGYGKKIEVTLEDKTVKIRDYGRGIPHGKVVECVSEINTGGKFNDDVFQFSVGLNGVGTKAVNALSSYFCVKSFRENKVIWAEFKCGKLKKKHSEKTKEEDGTEITFIPDSDKDIFSDYQFDTTIIKAMIQNYVFLNVGLVIYFNGEKFESKNGLQDLLALKMGSLTSLYETFHYVSKDKKLEFAFTHTNEYGEQVFSYANGQYTQDGGTHQSYFKEIFSKTITEYFKKSFSPSAVREGMVAAISIKVKEPHFDSQTKSKLTNTEIRAWIFDEVRAAINKFLLSNKESANIILEKITQAEKLHKEITDIKKSAKEAISKTRYNIPKLKDCKYHLNQGNAKIRENEGSKTMIFITEGDSAAGSITQIRDVYHQAVFALRGKVTNMYGLKKSKLYNEPELFNLTRALGIEESIDNLRYDKVIIATDADDDGYHIQNLLLTYFLTFFSELVIKGKVYILETPLFRVRNTKVTHYCYTESERDSIASSLSKSEITRFKGLGEISPSEFKAFISKDMRLKKVELENIAEIQNDLTFYMGANSPERRSFIVENLI